MRKLIFALILLGTVLTVIAQGTTPRLLPGDANSGSDEWGPVADPDGNTLYFTRLAHPQNMGVANAGDIWATYRSANGQWARAVNAGAPLNSREDDRVVGVHASGRRLFLYRPGSHTLFYSIREGRSWQQPIPIVIDNFSLKDKDAHFTFSAEGDVLLLSLSGMGRRAARGLYVCFAKKEGHYAAPEPLGPTADSPADEMGLWLAADGSTLYFSSNQAGGYGGYDLYCTRRLGMGWDTWAAPVNLGPDINTAEDDLFLSMPASGSPAYLMRRAGEGSMDIYEAELPDSLLPRPVVLLTGTIRDAASGNPVRQAAARFRVLDDGPLASAAERPGDDGHFQFILPHGQNVELSAALNGYFPVSEPLELSGRPLKEVDQEEPLLLASLQKDPIYRRRNEEIANLQLHLRGIDEELIQMQEERVARQKALADARRNSLDWQPPSDPELDALRHRFQQHTTARDTVIPSSYEYENAEDDARELQDMRERYNEYVQYQEEQQQQAEGVVENKNYLWEEPQSFDRLQKEVWEGMKEDLAAEVEQELSTSMLETVKQEVALSLNEQERRQLELKEDALRQEIRQSFGRPADWAAKGPTPEAEWERELRKDIRGAVEPEAKALLRRELQEDIRAALANDITYWAKKEAQAELQGELNEKLQLQIEQEKRRALTVPPASDVVAPLEPVPAPEAAFQKIEKDLLLVRAEAGATIPLNTVAFEPGKPTLKPAAYAELGRVLDFLKRNEGLSVEIGVHAGGQLTHASALSLTTQRARAVANYLIGHGIEEARVKARGYGKAFPVASGGGPEAHRRNQRVEMRILTVGN